MNPRANLVVDRDNKCVVDRLIAVHLLNGTDAGIAEVKRMQFVRVRAVGDGDFRRVGDYTRVVLDRTTGATFAGTEALAERAAVQG